METTSQVSGLLPIIAALSLFGLFGYVAYIFRTGQTVASHVIWSQELAQMGDLVRDALHMHSASAHEVIWRETPPMDLNATHGPLNFEMEIIKSGLNKEIRKSFFNEAEFILLQHADQKEIFHTPSKIMTPYASAPAGLLGRKYRYAITRGKIPQSGKYVLKAGMNQTLIAYPGIKVTINVIEGRQQINPIVATALAASFAICILVLLIK